ncbi:hypothetical protein F751_4336 [Auxenochlorella protothecoides]|uniref:Uncharacterized protein n=1 Tax=Auxenochlorella protothecoides TaxID=3075 RepID=A0A087ST07_AUXPR|nr:hypothetical protein F751_4336 [Auxenochlorella protothecoides]KFM28861.1 hypothetical protein F751_4336 [Auxenochlorella protothecoides]
MSFFQARYCSLLTPWCSIAVWRCRGSLALAYRHIKNPGGARCPAYNPSVALIQVE